MGIFNNYFKRKKIEKKLKNANMQINRDVHTKQIDFHDKMEELRDESEKLHETILEARKRSEKVNKVLGEVALRIGKATGGEKRGL